METRERDGGTPVGLEVELVPIDSVREDPDNARKHGADNLAAIKASLERFGQRKPIVVNRPTGTVIAGNGTYRTAKSLGWKSVYVAWADLDEASARAYALTDNHTGDLSEWDPEVLSKQLQDLGPAFADAPELGFEQLLRDAIGEVEEEGENLFTRAVNIPQYEITGEKPAVSELMDAKKTEELQRDIALTPDLPPEVRDFLIAASHRHTVFNYREIAEFYAHAPADVQELMERSALVIIDVRDAILNGFTRFDESVFEAEEGDESLAAAVEAEG